MPTTVNKIQPQAENIAISFMQQNTPYAKNYRLAATAIAKNTILPAPLQLMATSKATNSNAINVLASNDATTLIGSSNGLNITHDNGLTFNNATILNGLDLDSSYQIASDATGNYLFVSGNSDDLQYSDNGGITFQYVKGINGFVLGMTTYDHTLYVATDNGLYYAPLTAGQSLSFTQVTTINGLAANTVQAVVVNSQGIFAATQKGLCVSTDGAKTFTSLNTLTAGDVNKLYSHTFKDGVTRLYAINKTNQILESDDLGKSFNTTLSIKANPSQSMGFDYDDTIYIAADNALYKSSDEGKTFVKNDPSHVTPGVNPLPYGAEDISAISTDDKDNTVYASTPYGLAQLTNQGDYMSYYPSVLTGSNLIFGLYVNNMGNVLINSYSGMSVGQDGQHFKVMDAMFSGHYLAYVGKPFTDGQYILTLAQHIKDNKYALEISADKGNTYTAVDLPTAIDAPEAVYRASNGLIYIVNASQNQSSAIFVSDDNGHTFKSYLPHVRAYNVVPDQSNGYIYISTNNGLYFTKDGVTFTQAKLPTKSVYQYFTDAKIIGFPLAINNNDIYMKALDDKGILHLTVDNTGQVVKAVFINTDNGLSSNNVFDIALDVKTPNHMFVTTDKGINYSTDGGQTFSQISDITNGQNIIAYNNHFMVYEKQFDAFNKLVMGTV